MLRFSIALIFAGYAMAQMPGSGHPMPPFWQGAPGPHRLGPIDRMRPPEELKDFLGLEDKQVERLEQIARQAHVTMRRETEAVRNKEQQLRDLIEKATDPTAAGKLLFEIDAKCKAIPEIQKKAHEDALAVLTETQQSKLKQLRRQKADPIAMRQAVGLNLMYPPAGMDGPRPAPMMPPRRQGRWPGFGPLYGPEGHEPPETGRAPAP